MPGRRARRPDRHRWRGCPGRSDCDLTELCGSDTAHGRCGRCSQLGIALPDDGPCPRAPSVPCRKYGALDSPCLVGRRVMSGQGRPSEMAIMVISEGTGTSGPYRPVEADFSQASGRREVVPAPRRRRGGRSRVREEPRRTCDAGTVRGRYVAPRTVRSRPARTTPGPRSRPVA